MITKAVTCYECAYCGKKYASEEDCLKCESMHLDKFNAEEAKFSTSRTELANVYSRQNTRPYVITKEKVTETIEVDSGEVDENGDPIMVPREVEREVEKKIEGDVPILHCSRCSRLIGENDTYLKAFGHVICLECGLPILKYFGAMYTTFKTYFENFIGESTPHHSHCRCSTGSEPSIIPDSESKADESDASCSCCTTESTCRHYH